MSMFSKSAAALATAVLLSLVSSPQLSSAGSAVCGDNFPDAGEACDDGDSVSGDGCNSVCRVENGFSCDSDTGFDVTGDEACDSTLCDESETPPACEATETCGNGVLEANEGCDDGNNGDFDNCDAACLVEDQAPCNLGDNAGLFGDASCQSGVCDESAEPTPICVSEFVSTTTSTTSTTTMTDPSTTTTLVEPSTTTLPDPSTTTTIMASTTSSTMPEITGACCHAKGCSEVTAVECAGNFEGTYLGDDTSCTEIGACFAECGNGCIEPGEECDDADTANGDGCDEDCAEENCWNCSTGQVTGDSIPAVCEGGGPSQCEEDASCSECGNNEIEAGEQCDDGDTVSQDCCSPTCQYVSGGSACPNGIFCDGAETCDGSGNCNDGADPTCSQLNGPCVVGLCDGKLDTCVTDLNELNGNSCEDAGACATGEGGTCLNGVCVGTASTLSPTCRWIIIGGSPLGDVRVRTGPGSTVDADMCGDTARIGGITTDDIVAISTTGEGIRFYGPPVVDGDIVTGGSTVRSNLYLTIPGTALKTVDTAMTVAKLPSGVVDTTGNHALVDVCGDDQAILASAAAILDLMGDPDMEEGTPNGLKIGVGSSHTIDVTGDGVAVVDMNGLKISHGATLTLKGNADDVVMLRINDGRLKIGYGARVMLDGLVPGNVLIYADGSRCRVSPGVIGAGTIYCSDAGRFIIGAGVNWSGTFLGSSREVRVRSNAALTHVPFTGF
jgi:cysteine-rich repeat protein